MSLDFTLCKEKYSSNITHNLIDMAKECGVYGALWRPQDNFYFIAEDIIPVLEKGLLELTLRPEHYKKYNASNGWGTREQFIKFITGILEQCKLNPGYNIIVSV